MPPNCWKNVGKKTPLTDAQIKSFKVQSKRVRKSDGGGLYVEFALSGARTFRLAYRFAGQQRTLLIGYYPEMRLAETRHPREEVKAALRLGVDPFVRASPAPAPALVPVGAIWNDIADDYLRLRKRDGAAAKTITKLTSQIAITRQSVGTRPISGITARDIIALVRPIETSGRIETAHAVRTRCSQIFRFAIAEGLATTDPAALVGGAMVKRARGGHAGLTDPKAIGKLMAAIRNYQGEPQIRAALLLSAYLFPRNTELRGMRWDEIDWEGALWSVPGTRMKMKLPHLVPLPRQAVTVLRDLKPWTGRAPLVIPSPRDPTKMVSDATFNKALRSLGVSGALHVHHGFRITASTTLNELGWNRDWVERQFAHTEGNKVRHAYNHAEYLEGRTAMMQTYADWLDAQEKDVAGRV